MKKVIGLTFTAADKYMHDKGYKLLESSGITNKVSYVKGHRRVDLIFLLYPKVGYLCTKVVKRRTNQYYK